MAESVTINHTLVLNYYRYRCCICHKKSDVFHKSDKEKYYCVDCLELCKCCKKHFEHKDISPWLTYKCYQCLEWDDNIFQHKNVCLNCVKEYKCQSCPASICKTHTEKYMNMCNSCVLRQGPKWWLCCVRNSVSALFIDPLTDIIMSYAYHKSLDQINKN